MNAIGWEVTKGAALGVGKLAVEDPEKLRERADQIDKFVVDNIKTRKRQRTGRAF